VSRLAAPDGARLLVRREHPVARIAGLAGLIVLWELLMRTGWIVARPEARQVADAREGDRGRELSARRVTSRAMQ
jgi:hypothetical protein